MPSPPSSSFTRYIVNNNDSFRGSSIALVTGGSRGIGKAIASKIAEWPFIDKVLVVSRNVVKSESFVKQKEEEDKEEHQKKFVAVPADITTPEGRSKVVQEVEKYTTGQNNDNNNNPRRQLRFLVHSAGTIGPIQSVRDIEPEDFQHAMKVNVEGPFFLSTQLYKYMVPPPPPPAVQPGVDSESSPAPAYANDPAAVVAVAGRILHVSSGAAHGPPPVGWSVYGMTKAAFYQSFMVLDNEFSQLGGTTGSGSVRVGSFKPGVVDTDMQGEIRDATSERMPAVTKFQNLKDEMSNSCNELLPRPPPTSSLDSPENVAYFAEYLLLGTTDEEFANLGNSKNGNEYDIRDSSLYDKWIPEENRPEIKQT